MHKVIVIILIVILICIPIIISFGSFSKVVLPNGEELVLGYEPKVISSDAVQCFPGKGTRVILISPNGEQFFCNAEEWFVLYPSGDWSAKSVNMVETR